MMFYLACPYTHSDATIQKYRYRQSCRAASRLMQQGIGVFSPLANSIPAIEFGGLELEHDGFMNLDLPILRRCDEVVVLALPDWKASVGVRREMLEAFLHRKPVVIIAEHEIELLPDVLKTAPRFSMDATAYLPEIIF
ncbi:MAG: DUF1937 family protein [Planctomycetaceae bacterium]|jgi:hypothetical protein|nr:DUF1937 family protein [Planctomycetaceae bacterium]